MDCILLSGATGVVGSALLPWLLSDDATQVKLLLRAESEQHLQQRLTEILAACRPDGADSAWEQRVEALRGDVGEPRWGLSQADFDRLGGQVNHVIHAAGNVRLNQPLEQARRAAVNSVVGALELARACQQHGQLVKVEIVSTVGVAGKTPGLIQEIPYQPASFHNTYEQAKAEAEKVALDEMARGLPLTIHRPSMVVGDSRDGRIPHFQVFYHLTDFLSGLRTRGIIPDTGRAKLDIIPSNLVAQAIYLACRRPETAGEILHLCTGPDQSWTLSQWTEWLRGKLADRGQRLPRLRKVAPERYRRMLRWAAPFVSAKRRRFLRGLPFILDYLAEEQNFDNSRTREQLSFATWQPPSPESYLDAVMETYWKQRHS